MDRIKILKYAEKVQYSDYGTFTAYHDGVSLSGSTVSEVVAKMLAYDQEKIVKEVLSGF